MFRNECENRIRGLYRTKLTFPSVDIDEIMENYQEWEKDKGALAQIEEKYMKASEKVQDFIQFEKSVRVGLEL